MYSIVKITNQWYTYLREKSDLSKVNLWSPTENVTSQIKPHDMVFFAMSGHNSVVQIIGYGMFEEYVSLSLDETWKRFTIGNGVSTYPKFKTASLKYPIVQKTRVLHNVVFNDVHLFDAVYEIGTPKLKFANANVNTLSVPNTSLRHILKEIKAIQSPIEKDDQQLLEGRLTEAKILRRQRNRKARQQCLEASGYKCYVCGFDFYETYGEVGKEFLEVHHKKPMATYDDEHPIPVDELCALCSNCHAMVHRRKEVIDVEELKKNVEKNRK